MFDDRYRGRFEDNGPERPRSEPEIIPPDHSGSRNSSGRRGPVWVTFDRHGGTHRIYVAQPGPLSVIAALVIAGLVLGGILLLLLGLVLFWVPILVALVAGFVLSGTIRYHWRRFRAWLRGGA